MIMAEMIWLRVSVEANVPRERKAHPSRNSPAYPQKISFQAGVATNATAITPGRVAAIKMANVVRQAANLPASGCSIGHRIGEQQFDCAAFAFFRVEPHC